MKKVIKIVALAVAIFFIAAIVFYIAASPAQKAQWAKEQHAKDSIKAIEKQTKANREFVKDSIRLALEIAREKHEFLKDSLQMAEKLAKKPEKEMEPTSKTDDDNTWKIGGTLMNTGYSAWSASDFTNKLATCAELTARYMLHNNKVFESNEQWKKAATAMVNCIDEVYRLKDWQDKSVTEAASACLLLAATEKN